MSSKAHTLAAALLLLLLPGIAHAQMDMLPQLFRDLPPELQQGLPESMEYDEYRRLTRNVDFFTMFMSAVVPGYALFQVEKPLPAWIVASTRIAGYSMMATAVARQWDNWRDLTQLNEIPDPRYRQYRDNALLFAGGVAINGVAWAVDLFGAYHIAKREKDFVIYKYGLRETLGDEEEEREIRFIRKLILQEEPGERQVQEELEASISRYIATYPRGPNRGEVEFYLGSLYLEWQEPMRGLLHFARSVYLYPDPRFIPAARRNALAVVQRNRRAWAEDWELLIASFEKGRDEPIFTSRGDRVFAYLDIFRRLQGSGFRRLYAEEALRLVKEEPTAPFADDALLGAGEALVALEEMAEAVITYTKLAGGYPDSPYRSEAVLKIAELLTEMGEPEYAARFYRRVIESAPESPEAGAAADALREGARN